MKAPALRGIWLNPAWITESRLYSYLRREISQCAPQAGEKWLDVGCGSRPYESMFPQGSYVGVDVASSGRPADMKMPDYFYDGQTLPFEAGSMDGVLCTQVLEHVRDPDALLHEIGRVLRPDGTLILSAPFVWEEHEEPYDFFRFTSFGFRELLERCGLEVRCMHKTTGTLESAAQVLSIYAINNLALPVRGWSRLISLFVCCPIQIAGLALQRLLPDQKKFFLDCVIVARRKAS